MQIGLFNDVYLDLSKFNENSRFFISQNLTVILHSGTTSNQFEAVFDYDLKSLVVPEILYLQSVGVLKISKDAADSLAHHILKVIIVYNHSTKIDIDKDTAYVKRERESGTVNENLRETLKLNYSRIENLKFPIAERVGKNTFFIKNVSFGAHIGC